jgi:cystathionine beta-lyase/cystathionine gamma-synthase
MLSFELKDASHVVDRLRKVEVITLAESLGGVESLIEHPDSMTHASVPKEQRLQQGITEGLVRFSVGLEDPKDLLDDLERVLG